MTPDIANVVADAVHQMGGAQELMQRVVAANPRLDGAHVADVLAIAHDADATIEFTEPVWESEDWPDRLAEVAASVMDTGSATLVAMCMTAEALRTGAVPAEEPTGLLVVAACVRWMERADGGVQTV